MIHRVLLGCIFVAALGSCQQQSVVGARFASSDDLKLLQAQATKSCQCANAKKQRHYQPDPDGGKTPAKTAEKVTDCWQVFAQQLRPFKFELPAVAACGPGSEYNAIDLLQKSGEPQSVVLNFGFGTCSAEEAKSALAQYERQSRQQGC